MAFSLTTSGDKLASPTWNYLRREWPHIICGELTGLVSGRGPGVAGLDGTS